MTTFQPPDSSLHFHLREWERIKTKLVPVSNALLFLNRVKENLRLDSQSVVRMDQLLDLNLVQPLDLQSVMWMDQPLDLNLGQNLENIAIDS